MAAALRLKLGDISGQLLKDVSGGGVDKCMDGVEPQTIEMIIAQPHQCIVTNKAAYFVAIGAVEIDGIPPGSGMAIGEIRREAPEIISRRPEMVINNVKDHGQAARVAGIHQVFEIIGRPIGVMRRIKIDPVITPPAVPENSFTGINSIWVTPRSDR